MGAGSNPREVTKSRDSNTIHVLVDAVLHKRRKNRKRLVWASVEKLILVGNWFMVIEFRQTEIHLAKQSSLPLLT